MAAPKPRDPVDKPHHPQVGISGGTEGCRHVDWLAGLAMHALIARGEPVASEEDCDNLATAAYQAARAMMTPGRAL